MKEIFTQIICRIKGNKRTTFLGIILLLAGFVFVCVGKASFNEWALSWPAVIALLIVKDDLINSKPS